MRLGKIQKLIVAYLEEQGGTAYLGVNTQDERFRGYFWEEVQRSRDSLIRRGIVVRVSKIRIGLARPAPEE